MTPEVVPALQVMMTSWVPLPDRATDCGLEAALSVMVIEAELAPMAEGVNRTTMEQLAPAASEAGQLLFWAKSLELEPASKTPEMVRADEPPLVSVTVWAELVMATGWLAKARELVERETLSEVELPVPERLTD